YCGFLKFAEPAGSRVPLRVLLVLDDLSQLDWRARRKSIGEAKTKTFWRSRRPDRMDLPYVLAHGVGLLSPPTDQDKTRHEQEIERANDVCEKRRAKIGLLCESLN